MTDRRYARLDVHAPADSGPIEPTPGILCGQKGCGGRLGDFVRDPVPHVRPLLDQVIENPPLHGPRWRVRCPACQRISFVERDRLRREWDRLEATWLEDALAERREHLDQLILHELSLEAIDRARNGIRDLENLRAKRRRGR